MACPKVISAALLISDVAGARIRADDPFQQPFQQQAPNLKYPDPDSPVPKLKYIAQQIIENGVESLSEDDRDFYEKNKNAIGQILLVQFSQLVENQDWNVARPLEEELIDMGLLDEDLDEDDQELMQTLMDQQLEQLKRLDEQRQLEQQQIQSRIRNYDGSDWGGFLTKLKADFNLEHIKKAIGAQPQDTLIDAMQNWKDDE